MVTLQDAINTMHTRGLSITSKDFVFAMLVTIGEDSNMAYAIAYEQDELARHIGTEKEDEYVQSKHKQAENVKTQQNIIQLLDLLSDSYRTEIQRLALDLKDYKFSGEEAVQILNNILKNRIEDLETASVRDVVSVIKMLTEQGALETGDGGFSKHFITVPPKYNTMCPKCNKEGYSVKGLDFRCEFCGHVSKWVEEEQRYYPQMLEL